MKIDSIDITNKVIFNKIIENPVNKESIFNVNKTNINKNVGYSLRNGEYLKLHNRRYIGNKYKLLEWIFEKIKDNCEGSRFADLFAGTGVVAAKALENFNVIILNDFLYSNNIIYKAFLGNGKWNKNRVMEIINNYNLLLPAKLKDNYFSYNFGNKFFSNDSAKIIGYIREDLENKRSILEKREYYILLASLIYTADKIANTVGHFEAFFKKDNVIDTFVLKPILPLETDGKEILIYKMDANNLAKNIRTDITYLDPPYNSRQYSRFYHVLETLAKWDKPKLFGVALKPPPENMSDYCRVRAKHKLNELINNLNSKYVVLSYNNTYESKSKSSKNKIKLEEIEYILRQKGHTKYYERDYKHFDAGKTDFDNHKEYLFITELTHG